MPNIRPISQRTRDLASKIITVADKLAKSRGADLIARQIIRSATSVGANYSEAQRARSRAEFISKLALSLQELEETKYWLDLIESRQLAQVAHLLRETDQLLAMLNASLTTARRNNLRS